MQPAANIYTEEEYKAAADNMEKELTSPVRRVPPSAVRATDEVRRPQMGEGSQDKLAYDIGMCFRSKETKFSDNLGESWQEFVAEYQQVFRDFSLSDTQKKQYLNNLLKRTLNTSISIELIITLKASMKPLESLILSKIKS